MKHKGKILEKAVRNSKIPIKRISEAVGYSGRHMYNFFEKEDLPLDLFVSVSKVIGHDFTEQIPELIEYMKTLQPSQNETITGEDFKRKYYDLLETYVRDAKLFQERLKALEDEVFKNQIKRK